MRIIDFSQKHPGTGGLFSGGVSGRGLSEGFLEGPGEGGHVGVGAKFGHLRDIEFRMVVQQETGPTHADRLDERLGRFAEQGGKPLAQQVGTEAQALCSRCRIDGAVGDEVVDDGHGLLHELPVSRSQFVLPAAGRLPRLQDVVVMDMQLIVLLAQFADVLAEGSVDLRLGPAPAAHDVPDAQGEEREQ